MSPQAPQPYTPFQGGAAQTLDSTHTPAVDNTPSSHRSGHREESTMSIVPTYWQSISLDELNEKAAMQTRVDRKYIVDADYAASILAELPADEAAVLEIDGQREFAYDSVYFDTPDLVSYKASAIGSRNRFKVRTRSYLDSDLSFLEVKTEGAREFTVKERIPYSIENRDMLTAEGKEYVATALEQLTDASVDDLEPVIRTGYRRTTVYLPQSEQNPVDSRLTIDTSLTWTPLSESVLMYTADGGEGPTKYQVGTEYTAPGTVIIETKSGSAPSVADKYLWRAGIRPVKISKFATGMAALNPQLPANKWKRTIQRWMQLEPAA